VVYLRKIFFLVLFLLVLSSCSGVEESISPYDTSFYYEKTSDKVINLDLTKNLKDIKNSTLLIWGENDTDTPIYMAKIMEKNIGDSGLVVLKGAGHFSYIDSSNEFNIIADNFLL
jgi:pimeloyl-ACP methyl ester carboxylesterase